MILLSFDFEEFDVPREHGVDVAPDKSVSISVEGANRVLDVLDDRDVRATFFCTAQFATHAPEVMERIAWRDHEVASHGYSHTRLAPDDAVRSKAVLEEIYGFRVNGYRQPRMADVSMTALREAGYAYDSSLNPTVIPGRYMHLSTPRTWYLDTDRMVRVPVSVSPLLRLPLFWLSLHHFPERFYHWLADRTVRRDGYLLTYFHPWEFTDETAQKHWNLPYVIRRRCGEPMVQRLGRLIDHLKAQGQEFKTISEFLEIE